MNRHDSESNFQEIGSELTLPVFMSRNFESDPEWFAEPEDLPDYGPPGMPTPWQPLDSRIAERQRHISDSLRELLNSAHLPASLDHHMVDMLQLNFDSFNTILGVNNNDSYNVWKSQNDPVDTDARLREIEDDAVLGLASQEELAEFILNTEGIKSVEFWRLFHAFKQRMRHLTYRRDETELMIERAGGEVMKNADGTQYYGLKLFPYVVESYRDLTVEEHREISLLHTSIAKKTEIFEELTQTSYQEMDKETRSIAHNPMLDSISDNIDAEEAAIHSIHEKTQVHTTEGLMASIKRKVGVIPKNTDKQIDVVERQLFAVDIASQKSSPAFQKAMHEVRIGQLDGAGLSVYENVLGHFMENSHLIIPVSTTTYGYETHRTDASKIGGANILADVALANSVRLRR